MSSHSGRWEEACSDIGLPVWIV